MTGSPHSRTLVLGIGNLLWADEGFGIRAVEALNAGYTFPSEVRLMDGGTQGLFLLPHVQAADALLTFDAIDFGLTPGTLRVIRDQDVPRYMGAKKVSMHPDRLSGGPGRSGAHRPYTGPPGPDRRPAGGARRLRG